MLKSTRDKNISITSSAPTDSKSAADFGSILFYDRTSANKILENCIIEYGGNSNGSIRNTRQTLFRKQSSLHFSENCFF